MPKSDAHGARGSLASVLEARLQQASQNKNNKTPKALIKKNTIFFFCELGSTIKRSLDPTVSYLSW